jgi:hypothetical protein
LKSASVLWNGSCWLKKTPEPLEPSEKAEERLRLWDDYEQLRSYALSPVKALSNPLGLDLWCKRGFLSWISVMRSRNYPERLIHHASALQAKPTISAETPISLVNIIIEWSETNGRIHNRQD